MKVWKPQRGEISTEAAHRVEYRCDQPINTQPDSTRPRNPALCRSTTNIDPLPLLHLAPSRFLAALYLSPNSSRAQQPVAPNNSASPPAAYGQFLSEGSTSGLPPISPLPPIIAPSANNSTDNSAASIPQDPRRVPALLASYPTRRHRTALRSARQLRPLARSPTAQGPHTARRFLPTHLRHGHLPPSLRREQ